MKPSIALLVGRVGDLQVDPRAIPCDASCPPIPAGALTCMVSFANWNFDALVSDEKCETQRRMRAWNPMVLS